MTNTDGNLILIANASRPVTPTDPVWRRALAPGVLPIGSYQVTPPYNLPSSLRTGHTEDLREAYRL